MTTKAAAKLYLAQHKFTTVGREFVVYNPKNEAVNKLPVIYGFNNGGSEEWCNGVLLAEDGTYLGGHICSDEGYMLHDLGILEGTQPDRHETFIKHYPKGYRMDFVSSKDVPNHIELTKAYELNQIKGKQK